MQIVRLWDGLAAPLMVPLASAAFAVVVIGVGAYANRKIRRRRRWRF